MPTDPPTQDHHRLSSKEHARIFREQILPDLAGGQEPQAAPLAVLLGGQPGIGKSSTKSAVVAALREHGGVLDFSADLLRPYHPGFARLLAGDERQLAALDADIDLDARAWVDLMVEHAVTHRYHAILDSNLASPDRARTFIDRFADAGYRIEIQFVAGPAALSRLGVLQRFQRQVDELEHGAYCAVPIQDRNYVGVLDTAAMLDQTVCADRVAVSRRGGTLLHEQRRLAGAWRPAAAAVQAIQAERHRPWTNAEQSWFIDAAQRLVGHLAPAYLNDLADACELARPLFTTPALPRLEILINTLAAHRAQAAAALALGAGHPAPRTTSPGRSTDATPAPPTAHNSPARADERRGPGRSR